MKLTQLRKMVETWPSTLDPRNPTDRDAFLCSIGMEPGDIYQELEMESRFVDTHRDYSYVHAHVDLHSHNFFEILYCRSCGGVEYMVGANRYRLQKGDVVLIPPGISHRPLLPEDMPEPYIRDVLWISTEFVQTMCQWFPDHFTGVEVYSPLLGATGNHWDTVGELFDNGVNEAIQRRDDWQIAVLGNTITLLTQLRRGYLDRAARPLKAEKPELLDQITAYVEQHYASPISIADLTKQFYVSSSTVSHLFKQKLGVSFYRYVTQRRLIAAKTHIEKGWLLEDVAAASGFSDYSGFYRAFKQEYGISPRQYRKVQETGQKTTAKNDRLP